MTVKTHERTLAKAINEIYAAVKLDYGQATKVMAEKQNIIDIQRHQIAQMQHFYNKGRAVHAADVRYEEKKKRERATKVGAK